MNARPSRRGAVLMEFAISFPILLVLMLGCVQFAHLWIARLGVHYAAYSAARAALVTVCDTEGPSRNNDSWPRRVELPYEGFESPYTRADSIAAGRLGRATSEAEWAGNRAAEAVCAWFVKGAAGSVQDDRRIPGWGRIPGSDAAARKTRTVVRQEGWNVSATVEHDFALVVPIVGAMIAWGSNPWDENEPWKVQTKDTTADAHLAKDLVGYPHLRLTETVWLPKPYRTPIAAGDWNGFPQSAGGGSGW